MKLIIPPECQIGAHTYKIRISNKALDIAELRGQVRYITQIIRISTHTDTMPRTNSMVFDALIHEMLHPISHLFMGGELTETQIEQIATGFTQVLLSLGIEPDFSQIPEEKL